MKTTGEIRRDNLIALRNEFGSIAALNDALGRRRIDTTLAALIRGDIDPKTGKRRAVGTAIARDIEKKLGKPVGWMDHEHETSNSNTVTIARFDLEAAAGAGRYVSALTRVESVRLAPDLAARIQRHAGVAMASLALITVAGDSMEPTMRDGDMVVIDCSARRVDRDGVYVFTYGNDTFVKRLQRMPNVLRACSDNKLYDPWDIADAEGCLLYTSPSPRD